MIGPEIQCKSDIRAGGGEAPNRMLWMLRTALGNAKIARLWHSERCSTDLPIVVFSAFLTPF